MRIFNSLPHRLTSLMNLKAQFKEALSIYLNTHSFYCVSNVYKRLIILLPTPYNELRITFEYFMWNPYTIFLLFEFCTFWNFYDLFHIWLSCQLNSVKLGSEGMFMYPKYAYHWLMFFPKHGNILCNIIICYRNFMNDQLHTKLLFNIQ